MVRLFLKRAPSDIVCQEMEATTWRNGSVLGDAVLDGQQSIVELFVRAGANMELDRGSYGTPLLAACAFGRLQIVKYLVRAGAKFISTKEGRSFSAVEAAQSFPDIIHWLLVERYVKQPKIGLVSDCIKDQELCAWSGLRCVKVETAGLYSKIHNGSMFDHAKELAKLRRRLQGEVVHVISDLED